MVFDSPITGWVLVVLDPASPCLSFFFFPPHSKDTFPVPSQTPALCSSCHHQVSCTEQRVLQDLPPKRRATLASSSSPSLIFLTLWPQSSWEIIRCDWELCWWRFLWSPGKRYDWRAPHSWLVFLFFCLLVFFTFYLADPKCFGNVTLLAPFWCHMSKSKVRLDM